MAPLLAFGPECGTLPPLLLAGLVDLLLSRDEPTTGDADRPDNWPPHWPRPEGSPERPSGTVSG